MWQALEDQRPDFVPLTTYTTGGEVRPRCLALAASLDSRTTDANARCRDSISASPSAWQARGPTKHVPENRENVVVLGTKTHEITLPGADIPIYPWNLFRKVLGQASQSGV